MNDNEKFYVETKYVLSIIFIMDKLDFEDCFFDIDLLKEIKSILEYLSKEGSIIGSLKNDICKYLQNGRNIQDKQRVERIGIINDIITILNNSNEDKKLTFYREELSKRRMNSKYLKIYRNQVIMSEVNEINKSIGYDSVVLSALSEGISNDEFIEEYFDNVINNPFTLESINSIIYECPSLFLNQTFYKRCMCILYGLNEKIIITNKNLINKMSKKLNKIKKIGK